MKGDSSVTRHARLLQAYHRRTVHNRGHGRGSKEVQVGAMVS